MEDSIKVFFDQKSQSKYEAYTIRIMNLYIDVPDGNSIFLQSGELRRRYPLQSTDCIITFEYPTAITFGKYTSTSIEEPHYGTGNMFLQLSYGFCCPNISTYIFNKCPSQLPLPLSLSLSLSFSGANSFA